MFHALLLETILRGRETVEVGANVVAGTDPDEIVHKTEKMMESNCWWENPFGDGDAAIKIVDVLRRFFLVKIQVFASLENGVRNHENYHSLLV